MSYRISEFQNTREFLYYNAKSQMDELETLEHIASGKRVNQASDDPIDHQRIQQMKTELMENSDFSKSIQTMLSEYNVVESSLNAIRDSLERVSELAIQGANETYGANGRDTIADEMEELYLGIISTLNTRHEGKYLFSGTATNTEPFQDTVTGNYSGNSDIAQIRISSSDTLASNIPGDEVAYGAGGQGSNEDILDLIQDLVTELRADNTPGIQTNLPRLKQTIDRVNGLIAGIGSKTVRLVNSQNYYQDFEINLRETMSELEDADMAEEISILNQNRTAQEAQYRSQSAILDRTLLDYLG